MSKVSRARSSTSSITKFATATDTGDPMAVPKTCLYDCPWKERYVAVRQNSKSWFNSSGLRDVREGRESSDCKRRLATSAASFTGTFVNNETTSKETRTSSSQTVFWRIKVENSTELRTPESVFPTRGERIRVRCFESWYIGDCTKETIGRSGTSGSEEVGHKKSNLGAGQ